jgi:hypothetical protein
MRLGHVGLVLSYKYYDSEHYPSFCSYLKHNVPETGFCFRLQVKPTQLGLTNKPPEIWTSSIDWAQIKKYLTLPGLDLRLLGRLCRSQSLYRLHYPGFMNFT